MNLKKFFLYLLIASVGVSALIGVGVMIFGNFGDFETKVLLTALTVTVTSIVGLACGAYFESSARKMIPWAGVAFALISAVLWLIMIWNEPRGNRYFAESVMTATLMAAACSLISLLSMARLDARFMWSRLAAHIAIWSLSTLILVCIWAEIDPSQEAISRTMGALSIVIGALTVVTPVFHKLSGGEPDLGKIDAEIEILKLRIAELEKKKAGASQSK